MKVLSLLQPWASLVVLGHKKIETRSWNTKYRGPLLIHASANRKTGKELAYTKPFIDCLFTKNGTFYWDELPFGAIIGKVHVVSTLRTDDLVWDKEDRSLMPVNPMDVLRLLQITPQEAAFGDYSPGRYGWLLSNPVAFDTPIPAKGSLGLWEYHDIVKLEGRP